MFDNKAPLRPVEEHFVMERHQIDRVDMRNNRVLVSGIRYRYVMSILDVVSRYLWLCALSDKSTVAKELKNFILNLFLQSSFSLTKGAT